MRLIDAAIKDLEMIGDCRTCGNKTPFCDSNPDSCSGYKWRGVPPDSADDNPPLTLEQLWEIDGEPVWCEKFGWQICYGITIFWGRQRMETGAGSCILLDDYGKTWRAYRRKPEEGTV